MLATDPRSGLVRLVAIALAGILLNARPGLAQTAPARVIVEDVIPIGNLLTPTQRIKGTLKTKPGTEFKQETIDDDVRTLYQTKLFAGIQVEVEKLPDNKVKIYFKVKEHPSTIQEIVFKGNKHLSTEDLEGLTGLRKGSPLNPMAVQMGRNAIIRRYNEQGRMLAGVEILEGDKPGDRRVVYSITEGHVAKVKNTLFEGNEFVSGARLRTQIETTREFIWFGGTYEADRVDADKHHLEEYYKANGFHDVKVGRELIWSDDHRHVDVKFVINEGIRYRVGTVTVENAKSESAEKLLAQTKLKEGTFYNKGRATTDKTIIETVYGYDGHAVLVQEQDTHPSPGVVNVQYVVQEKPPARVGDIKIVGNEVTRENVIRRNIPLYPGQPLTYPDTKIAEKNLQRLNIFENDPAKGIRPTVTVLDPDSDTEFKDILVQVQEAPTGSLMFGLGVNSDAGFTGSIVLNERNFDITRWPTNFDDLLSGRAFRGAGQELRIEAVPGTQLQRYSASWRDPAILDSQFGFGTSVYYYDRIYNEYTENRVGFSATLDRRLNALWRTSGTARVESVGVFDIPIGAPPLFYESQGRNFEASLRGALTRDNRDSFLRPTEGSLVEFGFTEFMGTFTFPQFTIEGSKFFTTYERPDGSGRHVLALHSMVGWSGDNTPVFQRFYAGGYQSMRGFQFRGIGHFVNGFNEGGNFELLNSAEYQIPLLANDQLYSVFFCDTGTVEESTKITNYRVSIGTGLRIVVPMMGPVPIAIDFGFPLVKGPQDQTQLVSFWVGYFH